LSYERPEFLISSIESLFRTTKWPFELIIVDDGSTDDLVTEYLAGMYNKKKISTLILNAGKNMGVGEGVRRGFAIARGDYLVKADQDLIYSEGWLTEMIKIIETWDDIGMVGGFKYMVDHPKAGWNNTNPILRIKDNVQCFIVDDFVSSLFLIKKETYEECGEFPTFSDGFGEDVTFKDDMLKPKGYKLALTCDDVLVNVGFGLGRSSMFMPESVPGKEILRPISKSPKIFGGKNG